MGKVDYRRALAQATTVPVCQAAYEKELAKRAQEDRHIDPQSYRTLLAAQEVDIWVKAENRAQEVNSHHHVYGNLIQRRHVQ